jgi:hypothetical protein
MYGMVKFGEWGVSTDADGLLCKYYYYYYYYNYSFTGRCQCMRK